MDRRVFVCVVLVVLCFVTSVLQAQVTCAPQPYGQPLTVQSTSRSWGLSFLPFTRTWTNYDAPGYRGAVISGPFGKLVGADCTVYTPFGRTTVQNRECHPLHLGPWFVNRTTSSEMRVYYAPPPYVAPCAPRCAPVCAPPAACAPPLEGAPPPACTPPAACTPPLPCAPPAPCGPAACTPPLACAPPAYCAPPVVVVPSKVPCPPPCVVPVPMGACP